MPAKAVPDAQPAPGADVPQDWWSAVQKDLAQSEYNVTWQEQTAIPGLGAAWQAPNRAHDLRTYFTNEGPRVVRRTAGAGSWTWGLELTGFGGGEESAVVPALQDVCAEGNRITFERDGLAEWYVNTAAGLEQGFTVYQAPASGTQMVVRMAVRGDLAANMTLDGQAVEFLSTGGVGVMHYGKLLVTDASGRTLPSAMTLEDGGAVIELRVDAAGAAFPVTIDPLATSVAWTAESNQASAKLGWSVATAGDVNGDGYSDVIVGAPNYDKGQTDEGRVFVYHGSATGLPAAADWTAESDQASAYFGTSVATAGDVDGKGYAAVIIGAPYYDNGESNEGRAYAYYGSSTGLSAAAGWTAESNQANAEFGGSVSSAGDVNGDGYSDVIVGAAYYDDRQANEGRVFVYHGASKTGLSATAAWTAEINVAEATLGTSVSMAGDVNGDGYGDVVVGAPMYTNGQTNEGRALVYHGSSTGLAAAAAWSVQSDLAAAYLGCSVSTAGDVNGDGYADVIVGAYGYGNGEAGEGRALVYHGASTGLATTAAWTEESNQADAQFGWSVSTAGDVNGDGYADVVIGAANYESSLKGEGAAFVHFGSSTGLLRKTVGWTAQGNQSGAGFGFAVATAGDVNGDGYADVIVGAPEFDNGQTDEGRAHVYYGSASALAATAAWTDADGRYFGNSVSTAGDVNGDGYADVIVGAFLYDNGQTYEGRAYVYHGSSSGLSATANWTAESNQEWAQFGKSVSTAGDVNGDGYADVIIGAPDSSNGQTLEGLAYVYLGSPSGLAATATQALESNRIDASFGSAVSTAGDVNGDGYADVIVGAERYSNGQVREGRVYVYHGSVTGPSATANWTVESDQADAELGRQSSVHTAGDVNGDGYSDVIISAPYYDNGQENEGRVFVYHGSASGLSVTENWTAQGDQVDATFGSAVSAAGDVNGDGYADVIVGASMYDNGEDREGRAFVYLGSASGLSATEIWTAEANRAEAGFGISVSTAGDVNGDGYADVIVGAAGYDNGEYDEGRAFVYLGSASGLSATEFWTAEANQATAYFGCSVSTAGDVNGDGYADVIIGAFGYDNGQTAEGRAFVYYGNAADAGRGLSLTPRQRRGDDSAAVAAMGMAPGSDVRLAAVGRTPFGRSKVKLECEVKPLGTPFDGAGTLKTASWTSTGVGGASLSQLVSGLSNRVYHWRVRLLYSQVTTPLQKTSRWFTMPWNGGQEGDFRVAAPPILGGIVINSNRSATNNPQVALVLTWSGGGGTGVTLMRFSNDGSTWSAWEAAQSFPTYTLPAGADGHRTVRVQYRDSVGNSSAVFSDYIRLDTIAPTGAIIINGGAATTTSRNVTLGLTWADAGAGVSRMRFSDNGSTWTPWMPPTATRAHTLPLATLGYQTVRVQYLDGANNYSPVYNDYIKLVAP